MRSESSFLVRHIADCQAVVWFLAPSLDIDDASHWAMIVDKNFGLKHAILANGDWLWRTLGVRDM
jgi:hypothetical protein